MTTAKEHTETISLVKSTSPFDGLSIDYVEWYNKVDLTIHLKVMLNGRCIGTIRNGKKDYHPFEFISDTPMVVNSSSKAVDTLKKELEIRLETLFTYLNTIK